MSDWSSHAAQKIQIQREAKRVKDELALHDAKLLESKAPLLWEELSAVLVKMCEELNAEPGMRDTVQVAKTHSKELRVFYSAENRNIFLTFTSEHQVVTVGGALARSYRIQAVGGTREISFVDGNNMPITAYKAAADTLNELLAT